MVAWILEEIINNMKLIFRNQSRNHSRRGSVDLGGKHNIGINNIELIFRIQSRNHTRSGSVDLGGNN